MTPPHVPPTEAELNWLRQYAESRNIPVLTRACDEIVRLREIISDYGRVCLECGREYLQNGAPDCNCKWRREYRKEQNELRAASEGRG